MRHLYNKPKTMAVAVSAALALVALAGCFASDDAAASSLYVKDALTDDAAEVHVTFTQAQVLPAEAADWVTVYEGERTIDLLALAAPEAKDKLADLDLQPGAYAGLRIAAAEATVVLHNGTSVDLVVEGNMISLSEGFEVSRDGGLQILVDFDLERSVDLEAGTYAQTVKELRTSAQDIDGDGVPDFDDTDDSGLPEPAQERSNWFGLCTAWHNTETGQEHSEGFANSTAFQNLSQMASEANQTIEAFCDEQEFPGPPEAVPDDARAYYEEAMERRQAEQDRGDAERDRDDGASGNRTGNQSGNQTGGSQGGEPGSSPGPTSSPTPEARA